MRDAGCQPGIVSQTLPGHYDLTVLHDRYPHRYPYLLASTAQSANRECRAGHDILLAFPQARLELNQQGKLLGHGLIPEGDDFLTALDVWWQQAAVDKPINLASLDLPFQGGWFVYLGYELVKQIEPGLTLKLDNQSTLPIASATRIPAAIIYNHETGLTQLVAEAGFETCLAQMTADIKAIQPAADVTLDFDIELKEEKPDIYLSGVERVKQYIIDGDVFQVNLSRLWQGKRPADLSAMTLFRQLAKTNPAPFAGFAGFTEDAIISSSPERLVRTHAGLIETRPIAGTRPRGIGLSDDRALQAELIGHPKERAEHVMLIDLERNDLGRVCQPGTIQVNEMMALESYAHVHHIVSNVQGQLRENTTPGEVIRAVFPGGTITGCPKVRCMEIINELEQGSRGAYTGSMGYLNHNGDMDLNILIRTIVLDNGTIRVRAGAGLVADSDAERELEETNAKAKGMLMSLQKTKREPISL